MIVYVSNHTYKPSFSSLMDFSGTLKNRRIFPSIDKYFPGSVYHERFDSSNWPVNCFDFVNHQSILIYKREIALGIPE